MPLELKNINGNGDFTLVNTSNGGEFSLVVSGSTPSPTPSISITPNITPSVTPSITPSITPSLTPSLSLPSCYSVTLTNVSGGNVGASGLDCCGNSFNTGNLAPGQHADNIIMADPYLYVGAGLAPSNILPYYCP